MWTLVQVLPIKHNNFLSDCNKLKVAQWHCLQRAGIADGGEFSIRPPRTAAWLFDKVKY
jgi:hypothetical protein